MIKSNVIPGVNNDDVMTRHDEDVFRQSYVSDVQFNMMEALYREWEQFTPIEEIPVSDLSFTEWLAVKAKAFCEEYDKRHTVKVVGAAG